MKMTKEQMEAAIEAAATEDGISVEQQRMKAMPWRSRRQWDELFVGDDEQSTTGKYQAEYWRR